MIVLSRDEDARIAVEKLIDAGAMDLKNNEKFILYKSHLEALELFSEWSQLSMQSPRLEQMDKPKITSTSSFIQVRFRFYRKKGADDEIEFHFREYNWKNNGSQRLEMNSSGKNN